MVIYFSLNQHNFIFCGMISRWRVRLPTLRYETTELHCETDSCSACKEIPRVVWKPLSHYCVNRGLVMSLVSQRDECGYLTF